MVDRTAPTMVDKSEKNFAPEKSTVNYNQVEEKMESQSKNFDSLKSTPEQNNATIEKGGFPDSGFANSLLGTDGTAASPEPKKKDDREGGREKGDKSGRPGSDTQSKPGPGKEFPESGCSGFGDDSETDPRENNTKSALAAAQKDNSGPQQKPPGMDDHRERQQNKDKASNHFKDGANDGVQQIPKGEPFKCTGYGGGNEPNTPPEGQPDKSGNRPGEQQPTMPTERPQGTDTGKEQGDKSGQQSPDGPKGKPPESLPAPQIPGPDKGAIPPIIKNGGPQDKIKGPQDPPICHGFDGNQDLTRTERTQSDPKVTRDDSRGMIRTAPDLKLEPQEQKKSPSDGKGMEGKQNVMKPTEPWRCHGFDPPPGHGDLSKNKGTADFSKGDKLGSMSETIKRIESSAGKGNMDAKLNEKFNGKLGDILRSAMSKLSQDSLERLEAQQ